MDPFHSPWRQKLYDSGDDGALITITGFDHETFAVMLKLKLYEPWFESYSPWTGDSDGSTFWRLKKPSSQSNGPKRIITCAASLGLTLAWFRFRGAEFILQGWFGFTGTHSNVWLRFGRRMLLKALKKHPLAKVKISSNQEKILTLKGMCAARHPALEDVYCFADGLLLLLYFSLVIKRFSHILLVRPCNLLIIFLADMR